MVRPFHELDTTMAKQDLLKTLQRLISGMDERLVIFDNLGQILYASFGLSQLFDDEQLEGKSIFQFVEGEAEDVHIFLNNLSGSHFKDIQIPMIRNGKKFPVRLRMAAWSVSEGDFVVLASLVDATTIERKKRDLLRKTLTIEQLSKSRKIRSGKLHDAIHEILDMSSKAVATTRVNAWLFDDENTRIECIGNYDVRVNELVPQEALPIFDKPNYFRLFETEKIISTHDAQASEATSELNDSYLIPNNIQSLMDIPLRIEGEIIGVICFEEVGSKRLWSLQDQKFGLIAAQMVSLSIETYKRKLAQQQLESALRQQQRLMSETNHRIKNNLAITLSLLRLQLSKCQDDYHRNLIQSAVNRLNSIVALHELLADKTHLNLRVNLHHYGKQLTESLRESLNDPSKEIQLITTFDDCEVSNDLAITLGLIINETVTNAYKHAFTHQKNGVIRVDFSVDKNKGKLEISDNGSGIAAGFIRDGEGMDIIKGMADHINAIIEIKGDAGTSIELDFLLN